MIFESIIGMTIGKTLEFIFLAFAVLVLALIMLSIVDKCFKFFTYRYNPLKVQRGELIKKKMFKCSDVYELKWNGEVNPKGRTIILYVHDVIGNRHDADRMMMWFQKKTDDVSVVSYDQRWFGDNEIQKDRNYGANLSDLKEIIYDLHERYGDQKIILVGHGFGAFLALLCANENGVDKVFAGSMKLENGYPLSFGTKMTLFWSWIFSAKAMIDYAYDGADLTDDVEFAKELQKRRELQSAITAREYYQTRHLFSYAVRQYNKSGKDNAVLLQPAKSIYASASTFAKKASRINNVSTIYFKDSKHHLFNTTQSNDVFQTIFDQIK